MHVPLHERQGLEKQDVNKKRRMEGEVREVVGRRVGEGKGLKSDIKRTHLSKVQIFFPTETEQDGFDITKISTHMIWEHCLKHKCKLKKKKKKQRKKKSFPPTAQDTEPSYTFKLTPKASRRAKERSFFRLERRKSEEKDTYRATSL